MLEIEATMDILNTAPIIKSIDFSNQNAHPLRACNLVGAFTSKNIWPVIRMGKPWYGPFSIFTNKIEISMGHSL